jgi:hypothetical protein
VRLSSGYPLLSLITGSFPLHAREIIGARKLSLMIRAGVFFPDGLKFILYRRIGVQSVFSARIKS